MERQWHIFMSGSRWRKSCVLSPLLSQQLNRCGAPGYAINSGGSARTRASSPALFTFRSNRLEFILKRALECVRRVMWRMLYADEACVVSWSLRGLEAMMATHVFSAFGLIVSEGTETIVCTDSAYTGNVANLQHFGITCRQTTSFIYLGGRVTET